MRTPRGLVGKLREIISGTRPVPVASKMPVAVSQASSPRPLYAHALEPQGTQFDARSERNIKTLTPKAQLAARAWLAACRSAEINAVIICGTRTFAEQEEIYAQGRTKPGKVVTKAKAGSSIHNYGMAWDYVVFEGINANGGTGDALWESSKMLSAGGIALAQGLDWGGAWKSFKDIPHIQLPGLTVTMLKKIMPKGYQYS